MSGDGDAIPGGTYRDHTGSQRMDPAQSTITRKVARNAFLISSDLEDREKRKVFFA